MPIPLWVLEDAVSGLQELILLVLRQACNKSHTVTRALDERNENRMESVCSPALPVSSPDSPEDSRALLPLSSLLWMTPGLDTILFKLDAHNYVGTVWSRASLLPWLWAGQA